MLDLSIKLKVTLHLSLVQQRSEKSSTKNKASYSVKLLIQNKFLKCQVKLYVSTTRAGTASTDLTVETDMKKKFVPKNTNRLLKKVPSDILMPANISLEKGFAGLEKTAHRDMRKTNVRMSKILKNNIQMKSIL